MKKIALCTRYDNLGASSRLRFFAYFEAIKDSGFCAEIDSFFSNSYLNNLYKNGKKSKSSALFALLKRFAKALFYPDFLIVEYELLPQISYSVERLLLKNRRYILNFDDNVWEKYTQNPRLSDKYDHLVKNASGVIVANDFLAEKVIKFNSNIIKIPTVVDLEPYKILTSKPDKLTLCWIGTPVTYNEYLIPFAPTLQAIAKVVDFTLMVIAQPNLTPIEGVNMVFKQWSVQDEASLIANCHGGIMPLKNDPFAKGKSAYKIIQYFAAGIPAIASPVGENCNVVDDSCGFLPNNTAEWIEAVKSLQDKAIYEKLCHGASQRGYEFSLQKYRPIFVDFICKVYNA